MTSGVVTIGRRQYASGLYWENSPSGHVSQAARDAARQPGQHSDFYAVRAGNKNGRVPQFALSQNAPGHVAGMPALAACIANAQPGSWAGAFTLREGTAIVVVRDDLIVPDGDLFFQDETEARDRLLQEMALGGLQRVYAPEPWGVPGADTMPVSLLLNDRADVKLRSITVSRRAVITTLVVVGLLSIALGIGWYIQDKEAKEEAARQEALAKLEQMRLAAQGIGNSGQAVYPKPERRWETLPSALRVIESCRAGLAQVPLVVAGWQMGSVKCDGSTITVGWSRTSGFSAPPPNTTASVTGSSSTMTVHLPALTPRGSETLIDSDVVTRRYLAQNWPGSISRGTDDPPPPPPAGYTGKWSPPPPPWAKRSFNFTIPSLPWALPDFFSDMPGVVVNSLTLSSGNMNGSWTVEGVIYENRS